MTYREVIRPPWWVYGTAIAMTALFFFTFAAVVGVPAALVMFVLATAFICWIIERRRLIVTVDDESLHVGAITIPRSEILDAVALNQQALRDVAGPDADGRATLVLRNLATKTGVKVDTAGDDPPYWLISSARPEALASALNR